MDLPGGSIKIRALVTMLALAYPVAAHIAVARHSAPLAIASVIFLVTLILLPGLARGSRAAWLAVPAVIAGIFLLIRSGAELLPLYAPPVLFTGFMAWVFGRTLAPGKTPLIERFAQLMHEPGKPMDTAIRNYARRLTGIWTVLLATLSAVNLVLALLAVPSGLLNAAGIEPFMPVPQAVWSLFANVLNYVILAAFVAAEHLYRRHRFPQEPYRNILRFIGQVIALGPRLFAESRQAMKRTD